MRVRDQLLVAVVLGAATYFALVRIADAKSDAAVGGGGYALDARHRDELEAFQRLRSHLGRMGESGLADRLESLRAQGAVWVAPNLGPERWAVFVEALSLARRIYVRREALLDPLAHLYRSPRPDIPRPYQEAHAAVGLAGALRHEIAHHDGVRREDAAYDTELRWYEDVKHSPFLDGLPAEERRAFEWGIESAVLSARKARDIAAGVSAPGPP
jgi:hypothetical protein